jgi:predicted TIM-barrel fold metal-dependent hydrolase
MKQLAQSGAYIEHAFWEWMPTLTTNDPKVIVDAVKEIGAERSIMSTDLGQLYNPPAPEGMRLFIATMLRKGLDEQEIELMVKTNPAKLLNLD